MTKRQKPPIRKGQYRNQTCKGKVKMSPLEARTRALINGWMAYHCPFCGRWHVGHSKR